MTIIPKERPPLQPVSELPGFDDDADVDKKSPAPAVAEQPVWLQLNDQDLISAQADVGARVAEFLEKLKPLDITRAAMREEILRRAVKQGATRIAHPDFDVVIEPVEIVDVRISVLRKELDKLIADGTLKEADVREGLYLETPEPQWKTNRAKLKKLLKFGARAIAALNKGIVKVVTGHKLSIIEIEKPPKNVTPGAATGMVL